MAKWVVEVKYGVDSNGKVVNSFVKLWRTKTVMVEALDDYNAREKAQWQVAEELGDRKLVGRGCFHATAKKL